MQIVFLISMFIFGACLGSFLCCQARRLRLGEQGSKTTHKTRKTNAKSLPARSICLHCKKQLKWYDNIPILSWLILKGRCRYCHQKIGSAEILSELGTGLAFLALSAKFFFAHSASAFATTPSLINFSATPSDWLVLLITLSLASTLIFLAIYDGLYGQLPTKYLILAIILALVVLLLQQFNASITTGFTPDLIWQPILSAVILGGTYLILYLVSKGKWVGDGDWLLALAIGLALGHAWLALIALFLANLLACLCTLPRLKKSHQIHLGPFLVIAFFIVYSFSDALLALIP